MRVLLLTPDFPPTRGGVQNLLARLTDGLTARCAVRVATVDASGAREWDRARHYGVSRSRRTPFFLLTLALLALASFGQMLRFRPQVIVCGHLLLGPVCAVARRLFGIPYVVIGYGSEIGSRRMRYAVRTGLHGAAYAVTISEFARRAILAHGVASERVILIRPGPGLVGGDEPDLNGRDDGRRILLSVSRLAEPYKGHDNVLRALPQILTKVPDAHYVIVGDGPLRPDLERLASSLGVANAVTFTGEVSDEEVDAWYWRCDVFILCSREAAVGGGVEGYGLVFIEANLRGKPTIGGRSGGIPDAVLDGVTGLLVDPLDTADIAAAVVRLMEDPVLARRLGAEGRRRALHEVSWDTYLMRFDEVLRAAAGQPICART